MGRVRVFGELTGDRRSVTLGGRGSNNYIKSWVNFDWFRKDIRPSKRRGAKPDEVVEYIADSGTDSITVSVKACGDGSIDAYVYLPDLSTIKKGQVRVHVYGGDS